jgi:hypothetical protein
MMAHIPYYNQEEEKEEKTPKKESKPVDKNK